MDSLLDAPIPATKIKKKKKKQTPAAVAGGADLLGLEDSSDVMVGGQDVSMSASANSFAKMGKGGKKGEESFDLVRELLHERRNTHVVHTVLTLRPYPSCLPFILFLCYSCL